MTPTILLDMDGVLADFDEAACRAHGVDRELVETRRKPGEWSLVEPLGLTSLDEFWAPISALGEQFWLDIKPLPWLGELIELVEQYTNDWHVVTTPGRDPSSYSGKAAWLKQRFGAKFHRITLTAHKHLLADSGTVLIDDRQANIDAFRRPRLGRASGHGILFPSTANALYIYANDPLSSVQRGLNNVILNPKEFTYASQV